MNEYRLIYDFLYSVGITQENVLKRLKKLGPERVYTVVKTLIEYTNFDRVSVETHFDWMANSRLSGYGYLDSTLDNRLHNVRSLIRDSLLFADVLWIKNPLNSHFHCREDDYYSEDTILKLADDLKILYEYRIVLEDGYARICGTNDHFCHDCLMSSFGYDGIPAEYQKMVYKIEKLVKATFKDDVLFRAYAEGDKIVLQLDAARDDLFSSRTCAIELSNFYIDPPLEKAILRKSKKLYKKEVEQCTTIYCEMMRPIIDDVLMYNWFSGKESGGLSYFTSRQIDLSMIKTINSKRTNAINGSIAESLKHTLPTILNVPIEKILALRTNEKEAFSNYRDSYNKLLNDIGTKKVDAQHINEALYDTVMPNINKLNIAVRNSKEIAGRGLLVNAIVATGSMACGLVEGFLPDAMRGPLMALGVSNHGAAAFQKLQTLINPSSELRDNKFYFLWKLSK